MTATQVEKNKAHNSPMAFISSTGLLIPLSSRVSISRWQPKLSQSVPKRRATHANAPRITPQSMSEAPPINAPSGVLLILSSVLAIASVGCVFELAGGHPQYGATFTSGVLAVSLPGFLFFFYSAIRKGQQEALEDP